MRRTPWFVLSIVAACGQPASEPAATASERAKEAERAKVEPAKQPDAKVAAAKPDAKVATVAKPAPVTPTPTPTPTTASGAPPSWWVVAQRRGALGLGELGDGTIVVVTEQDVVTAGPDATFGAVKHVAASTAAYDSVDPAMIDRLGGRWPDDVWLVELKADMRSGTNWKLRHLGPNGWQVEGDTIDGVLVGVFDTLSPWQGGTTLARRQWRVNEWEQPGENGDDDPKAYDRAVAKYGRRLKKAGAKAKPAFVVIGGTAPLPPAEALAAPGQLIAMPTGDVFTGCDAAGAFVHHAPDGTKASVPLTAIEGELQTARLIGRAADRVYCVRSGSERQIARFDGKAWTKSSSTAKDEDAVQVATIGRDGPLWLLSGPSKSDIDPGFVPDNALRRLDDAGAEVNFEPSEILATEGLKLDALVPMQVIARAADDVWIAGVIPIPDVGSEGAMWVVLHSRAPKGTMLTLPPEAAG